MKELDLYCLCCENLDNYNKETEECLLPINKANDFFECIGNNHIQIKCVIKEKNICFSINDLITINGEDIDFLYFKNSLEKFFYEE